MIRVLAGVAFGLAIGWGATAYYFQGKIARNILKQEQAQRERDKSFGDAAAHWQALLAEANARPANVVERRVFVKADCVPAAGDPGVDAGGSPARIELKRSVVRGVESVVEDGEEKYRGCSYRLRALQEELKKQIRGRNGGWTNN